MSTRAAIYCRISDDREGGALGVKRQEQDCRALADRKGWPVAEVFIDNDVSAYSGTIRPAYRRMLAGIKDGDIDAVVVWHLDRLHRAPKELEEFFEVCDAAGVKDLASVTGDVDLSTYDGRFMARILGAVARKESDDKSRRTRRKHLELAEAGAAVGGGRPFGYEDDRVTVRPDEAELIREAARRVLAGDSIRGICADWNDRGIAAVRGGKWTQTSLRRLLLSHRIAGLRSHGKDGPVAPAVWPAILDKRTHERVRAMLLNPSRQATAGFGARSYLLTGFLVCGRCGTRLIARPKETHRRSYVCASGPGRGGCGGVRIVADPLEELIVEMVLTAIDSPELASAMQMSTEGAEQDRAVDDLAVIDAKLGELAEMWAAGEIGRAEWLTARKPLEARQEAARRALSRQRGTTALDGFLGRPGALRQAWDGLGLERRRAIIATVVDRVNIGPAKRGFNRFDPARVEVVWRA
ncbi:MAG: recombinase family protein [Actinomycetota bacterium]|nr:recombinase family protein [Actinomycetota bacterium]